MSPERRNELRAISDTLRSPIDALTRIGQIRASDLIEELLNETDHDPLPWVHLCNGDRYATRDEAVAHCPSTPAVERRPRWGQ